MMVSHKLIVAIRMVCDDVSEPQYECIRMHLRILPPPAMYRALTDSAGDDEADITDASPNPFWAPDNVDINSLKSSASRERRQVDPRYLNAGRVRASLSKATDHSDQSVANTVPVDDVFQPSNMIFDKDDVSSTAAGVSLLDLKRVPLAIREC